VDILDVLKAIGDETRIRILNALRKDVLCVCDLEKILDISQSNASRHLAILRRTQLITGEKKAQWVYFRLNRTLIDRHPFLREILDNELEQISKCRTDLTRWKRYRELGGDCTHDVRLEGE
jgi:ArsR family transcriptional regulator, arsenate/arsenite/antimonite-responsive transcriptional repressor